MSEDTAEAPNQTPAVESTPASTTIGETPTPRTIESRPTTLEPIKDQGLTPETNTVTREKVLGYINEGKLHIPPKEDRPQYFSRLEEIILDSNESAKNRILAGLSHSNLQSAIFFEKIGSIFSKKNKLSPPTMESHPTQTAGGLTLLEPIKDQGLTPETNTVTREKVLAFVKNRVQRIPPEEERPQYFSRLEEIILDSNESIGTRLLAGFTHSHLRSQIFFEKIISKLSRKK